MTTLTRDVIFCEIRRKTACKRRGGLVDYKHGNYVNNKFGDRIKKIILYGSYARGDFNTSSDVDIMILTDFTDDELVQYRSEIVELAYNIEWNNRFDIHLSPLIKNVDRFNYWLEALPFYMNVQKEGVVLS